MTSPRRRGEKRPPMLAPTPRAGGRPTKLTPSLQEAMLRIVRAESVAKHAALANGITERTLLNWKERGEKHAPACKGLDAWDEDHRRAVLHCHDHEHQFLQSFHLLERARGEAIVDLTARLMQAAQSRDTRAILAMLRALAPEVWTPLEERKLRVDQVAGSVGPPLIIELYAGDRDPMELADIERELEAADGRDLTPARPLHPRVSS